MVLGWWLPVPVLGVVLKVFGGFLTAVFLFVLACVLFAARKRTS